MKSVRSISPLEKGNILEDAVRRIEHAILRAAPGFSEGIFKIEAKKIIINAGVRHEIDLFVTATLPAGYSSIFIFECKNWTTKVGKNDIIIFQEKIDTTRAQTGFFVATAFTRDALAQAKKSSRLVLLTAKQYEPIARVTYPMFHMVDRLSTEGRLTFLRDGIASQGKPIDLDTCALTLSGRVLDAAEFANELIKEIIDSELAWLDSVALGDGVHDLEFVSSKQYADGEMHLNGKPVHQIAIVVQIRLQVVIASVSSILEISGRGRMLTLNMKSPSTNANVNVELVELSTNVKALR